MLFSSRGRELVLVELVGAHPPVGVDAEVLDGAGDEPAAVDAEVDVVAAYACSTWITRSPTSTSMPISSRELARERGGVGLAGLDAAAGELPEQRQRGRRRPLRDEVLPVLLDHRPDDADLPAHVPPREPGGL